MVEMTYKYGMDCGTDSFRHEVTFKGNFTKDEIKELINYTQELIFLSNDLDDDEDDPTSKDKK